MMRLLKDIKKNEQGATAVEYGLICALIVLAMVAALNRFADTTTGMWNNVSNTVQENA